MTLYKSYEIDSVGIAMTVQDWSGINIKAVKELLWVWLIKTTWVLTLTILNPWTYVWNDSGVLVFRTIKDYPGGETPANWTRRSLAGNIKQLHVVAILYNEFIK